MNVYWRHFLFYREVIESYFMSCIKEADVLKHKKPIVTHLQKRDHNQLWTGLQNGKYKLIANIFNRIYYYYFFVLKR